MDTQLTALRDLSWEINEVAAMSLALEDSMTALDLCADAVFIASGHSRKGGGQFYDVENLKKQAAQLAATPAVRTWIDVFLAQPDLKLLVKCRHSLTHRVVRRAYMMRIEQGQPMSRGPSEIAMLPSSGRFGESLGSLGDLIPRLVGFAEGQVASLCEAILMDYPAPL